MKNRGYSIQTLRKDMGTEYLSNTIAYLPLVNGIQNVLSGRAENGQLHVPKRMKIKFTEMARTMPFHAGLPKFW